MDSEVKNIFRENSTSYYYSSLLFSGRVREDVFKLYAFVRKADEFVDTQPQQPERLEDLRRETLENWNGSSDDKIVEGFLDVASRNDFEKGWAEAFLDSMRMDTEKEEYETLEETLEYVYGSAEVVGYMVANILNLDEEAKKYASLLGRSMQYCNFIRDIDEDRELGRRYLPKHEMSKYDLNSLEPGEFDEDKFRSFIRNELDRFFEWQEEAEKGFKYIPYRQRVPVILSSRLYKYTARRIQSEPMIVFEEKVRPSKPKIFQQLVLSLGGRK
jgi:phytoene synthase